MIATKAAITGLIQADNAFKELVLPVGPADLNQTCRSMPVIKTLDHWRSFQMPTTKQPNCQKSVPRHGHRPVRGTLPKGSR